MIATKQELKTNIGKLVWILPTGNNRPFRKSDEEVLYSSELLKVTLSLLTHQNFTKFIITFIINIINIYNIPICHIY